MHAAGFMAFARIAPVSNENTAVRTIRKFHAAKPFIIAHKSVLAVATHITAASALNDFLVGAPPMHIESEEISAISGGPVISQIDHSPNVRVTAAEIIRKAISLLGPTKPCV